MPYSVEKVDTMARLQRYLSLACLLATLGLQAAGAPSAEPFGVQAALVLPASPDLRITAGSPGYALGVHGTWVLEGRHSLRPRLDLSWLPRDSQTRSGVASSQSVSTQVSSLALGADYLYQWNDRCALGFGFAEVRWSVDSTHILSVVPGLPVTQRGTTSWTRQALGPVVTYRLTQQLEAEGRFLRSHYGQENQVASTVTTGLLWRF